MTKSNKFQAVAMAAMVAAMVMGFAATSEAQLNRKRTQWIASANDGGSELARKRQVFVADAGSLARRRTVYVADAGPLTIVRRSQWIMRGLLVRGR